jgi:hypothetical protein
LAADDLEAVGCKEVVSWVTDDTDHHLYDRLRRCHDPASGDATGGCMAAMAEIPRNRRRWVLPAARVVVGVLVMVIGASRQGDDTSAVWLRFGSLYGHSGCWSGDHRASSPSR